MSDLEENLLAENACLKEQLKAKDEAILAKDEQIALLAEALKIAQSAQYGRSTEKNKAEFENALELDFKDEVEEIKDAIQEVDAIEVPAHTRKKKSNPNLNGRVDIPADLPREEIYLDIPETEKIDPKTGMPLVKIGEDITEQLAIEPAKIYVKRFIRPKYANKQNAIAGIKTAELPPHHLNRCKADIDFISYLIEQKFLNYLPLYRQSQIFKRLGINIAESTMNDWVNNTALTLEELWEALGDEIKKTNFINTDDTPLDVLFPDAKSDNSIRKTQIAEGRLWCYRNKEKGLVYFDFSQNWKSSNPLAFLKGFKGYVQSDGYAGYKKVAKLENDIVPVGCWVHARRKFLQANTVPNPRAEKFITYT